MDQGKLNKSFAIVHTEGILSWVGIQRFPRASKDNDGNVPTSIFAYHVGYALLRNGNQPLVKQRETMASHPF